FMLRQFIEEVPETDGRGMILFWGYGNLTNSRLEIDSSFISRSMCDRIDETFVSIHERLTREGRHVGIQSGSEFTTAILGVCDVPSQYWRWMWGTNRRRPK